MKKKFQVTFAIGFLAFTCVGLWKNHEKSRSQRPDTILLENVEALSDDTEESQSCTRMINSAPCYEWVTLGYYPNTTTPMKVYMITHYRITAIEEYTPQSEIEICSHDQITDC